MEESGYEIMYMLTHSQGTRFYFDYIIILIGTFIFGIILMIFFAVLLLSETVLLSESILLIYDFYIFKVK